MTPVSEYRGRFAPSPSGPLHLGSVITALASYLQARAGTGQWFVRIDDLDAPRVVPGAPARILRELERLALHWDGEVLFQGERTEVYAATVAKLRAAGQAFPCACTRREVGTGPYPGTCRAGIAPGKTERSVRFRLIEPTEVRWTDGVQGDVSIDLPRTTGDFVIWRADDVPGYPLASVVDDIDLGITEVVRGADLLAASAGQQQLFTVLDAPVPSFAHLPLALARNRIKLSKASQAPPTDREPACTVLRRALAFLGQTAAAGCDIECPELLLEQALARWSPSAVPRATEAPAEGASCT